MAHEKEFDIDDAYEKFLHDTFETYSGYGFADDEREVYELTDADTDGKKV